MVFAQRDPPRTFGCMLTLSGTLTAHQRGRARIPHVLVNAADTRFAAPTLSLGPAGTPSDTTPAPIAVACVTEHMSDPFDAGYTLAIRNNAGALDYHWQFPNGTWTNLDTVTSGQGFAVARDQVNELFLLAYGEATTSKPAPSTAPAGPERPPSSPKPALSDL